MGVPPYGLLLGPCLERRNPGEPEVQEGDRETLGLVYSRLDPQRQIGPGFVRQELWENTHEKRQKEPEQGNI